MRIFVSHAAIDHALAELLIDLLQTGCGVNHNDIFCSSTSGNIPNGEFFVQHILEQLQQSELVIAILSEAYFRSEFCLAEAGAAQIRSIAGFGKLHSFIVPPVTFERIEKGVLHGVQTGRLNDPDALSELRDVIVQNTPGPPKTAVWDRQRKKFLRELASTLSIYAAERGPIRIVDLRFEQDPRVTYKKKLRIELENRTGVNLEGTAIWDGTQGVALFRPLEELPWQVWTPEGWKAAEQKNFAVRDGQKFRTWIGLGDSVTEGDVLRRAAMHTIGKLKIKLSVSGSDFERVITL